jgi:hypothetical protein
VHQAAKEAYALGLSGPEIHSYISAAVAAAEAGGAAARQAATEAYALGLSGPEISQYIGSAVNAAKVETFATVWAKSTTVWKTPENAVEMASAGSGGASVSHPLPEKMICRGNVGDDVYALQAMLNALGFTDAQGKPLVLDGIFGPRTEQAVRAFQTSRGIRVDGIVGPQTWGELYSQSYEFNSLEDAVLTWSLMYYPLSKSSTAWPNGTEYGAHLYQNNETGLFSFGTVAGAQNVASVRIPAVNTQNDTLTHVGSIHTHPNPGEGYLVEQFSFGDGTVTNRLGVPGFLVTPSGRVLRLDPAWTGEGAGAIPYDDPNVSVYINQIHTRRK